MSAVAENNSNNLNHSASATELPMKISVPALEITYSRESSRKVSPIK